MQSLDGSLITLQARSGWGFAGIFLVGLVICCLVMTFMMKMGMGDGSRSGSEKDKQTNRNEGEQPGTNKP